MQTGKLFIQEVLENKHNWRFRSPSTYESSMLHSSLWQTSMHFSTSLLIKAVTRAINAHICTFLACCSMACIGYGIHCHWLALPWAVACSWFRIFGAQQGISLHRDVCCESLKALALQVRFISPLENAEGNNLIIHLDLKLYGKTSKAMAAQARGAPP